MSQLAIALGVLAFFPLVCAAAPVDKPMPPDAMQFSLNDAPQEVSGNGRNDSQPKPIYSVGWAYGSGLAALVFGLLIFAMLVHLRKCDQLEPNLFVKLAGLTLILATGIALIVLGYSQEQTTSMIGLLGTLAGYLIGQGTAPIAGGDQKKTVSTTGSVRP